MTGFLVDENLSPAICAQLQRCEPRIATLAVGQPGAPGKSTPDAQILEWLETQDYFLITNNRASMPGHLRDHLHAGRHIPGIFIVPFPLQIGRLIDLLHLIWELTITHIFLCSRCAKLWRYRANVASRAT
ncbi:MAG: DUF5615 family PIN-like protein, partial [Anaerolineae bacterium]|nr:DUF5615 family PIN-like protein [Anaerolineae bacterium]